MGKEIQICKTSRLHDSKYRRIELHCTPDLTQIDGASSGSEPKVKLIEVWPAIIQYIQGQPGYRRMLGGPPKGGLNRQIQKILNAKGE